MLQKDSGECPQLQARLDKTTSLIKMFQVRVCEGLLSRTTVSCARATVCMRLEINHFHPVRLFECLCIVEVFAVFGVSIKAKRSDDTDSNFEGALTQIRVIATAHVSLRG